eukprot:8143435-Ditylum_brightwellii.AAC.1
MAVLQADALLAYRYINNRSDIIVSKDSDFPALVGPRCLMMHGFKYKQGRGKNIDKEEARWKKAKFPVLASPSPMIHALAAVAIGCDIYVGGIKNLGAKK